MTEIQNKLFELKDEKYAEFQAKLTPTVPREAFIGVRVPLVRKLARELKGSEAAHAFLSCLPHDYYDENMLHGLLISELKDYDVCLAETKRFLPFIDNWAVCDILSPKVFRKHRPELIEEIKKWAASEDEYTVRFGIEMLMSHFLDDAFKPDYLAIPAGVVRDEYYINMMLAWFFATALSKQWGSTIPYLLDNRLGSWVHNKTIQKAIESYRITDEQKEYLRTLRR